ncbi:hypothetical protein [Facklamia sp. P12934]
MKMFKIVDQIETIKKAVFKGKYEMCNILSRERAKRLFPIFKVVGKEKNE